ncbi:MAG: phosphoglucomutase, partial [Methanobacteriota archaeon]
KLFSPSGASFTQAIQDEVETAIAAGPRLSGWRDQGRVVPVDALSPYKQAILDAVSIAEEIAVVVDCGNGAGSVVTPYLLADAGVVPSCLNCNVAGRFARPSEPLAESVPYLPDQIRKISAACAIVHDGDADRMMAFDGRGRFITGDQMLMLFADYLGSRRVVTTFDASMAIEEIAEVKRTPVGDVYVSEQLLSWGDFGGEPSGAWVFPSHSYCPDGPYAAALFCEIASSCNVAEEIDRMHTYPVLRDSIRCVTREEANRMVTAIGAEKATDGLRVEDEDGWYLIRASGTEPKVRITAEGRTTEAAKRLMEKGKRLLERGKLV